MFDIISFERRRKRSIWRDDNLDCVKCRSDQVVSCNEEMSSLKLLETKRSTEVRSQGTFQEI
jgi:hypothetical protein